MLSPNNNPTRFYTNDVKNACNQAYQHYARVLTQYRNDSPEHLSLAQERCLRNLEGAMDLAVKAAARDDVATASFQLGFLVLEWAAYIAYNELLEGRAMPDPSDPKTKEAFDRLLRTQLSMRLTELQNAAGPKVPDRDQTVATYQQLYEQQSRFAQDAQHEHMQNVRWLQECVRAQSEANGKSLQWMHQTIAENNQRYADIAYKGVEKAQIQTETMYTYGAHVVLHAAEIQKQLAATQEQFAQSIKQNTPEQWATQQNKIERERWLRRGGCAIALPFIAIGFLVFAYLVMTHVVLR